ncbi:sugar ABC transporter ATP-binding protein [Salinisphaera sp. USBA-960]|nr:sugar ABC transporter ATP-binding protein [Salifodinibacter halophilus]NNC26141.1 sugar ABC transporter ATP-binding protein [Salifodinibacter halophilus]
MTDKTEEGGSSGAAAAGPFLTLSGIAKRFGSVNALTGVDLNVHAGEVVGLLGDNGAGKSTLVKIMSGVEAPSAGSVAVAGQAMTEVTPQRARTAGVETIYQDLALASNLDVAENIFLGREMTGRMLGIVPTVRRKAMREQTQASLDQLRIRIPSLRAKVSTLSGGQRQAVAIARALYWQAKLVIMDEPTAALGVSEHDKVIELVRELAAKGVAVILVTHVMQDALAVTDRITVLARGAKAMDRATRDLDRNQVVHAMMTGEAS